MNIQALSSAKYICIFILTLHSINCFSQYESQCGHDECSGIHDALFPQLIQARNSHENNYVEQINSFSKSLDTYTIPCVVHVIHGNGDDNISDEQIHSAFEVINNQLSISNNGEDSNIRLKLAKLDPDGKCTNGIERVYSTSPNVSPYSFENVEDNGTFFYNDVNLKNLSRWPAENYLNIWIVSCIRSGWVLDGDPCILTMISGYAYRPPASPLLDGIVMKHDRFGSLGTVLETTIPGEDGIVYCDPTDIFIHELGHYLGLCHPWYCSVTDDQCHDNSSCLESGDMVCDTPPQAVNSDTSCFTFEEGDCQGNSCSSDEPDLPDPHWSYMGYSVDCRDRFSIGQHEKMYFTLDEERAVLCSEENLVNTGLLAFEENTVTIDSNDSWDIDDYPYGVTLMGDLIIESDITFHTNDIEIRLSEQSKIVVKTGGKLKSKNCVFTNGCAETWAGIEVWGNSYIPQLFSNQGYLELKEQSTITNARCGVRLGNLISTSPWEYDWSKNGGIVRTENALFHNNRKDVEFLSYQNYYDNGDVYVLKKNKSYFYDTEFLIDEPIPEMTDLSQRVSLFDVDGIKFKSVHFHIEDNALDNYSIENRGIGIYSQLSSFNVFGKCSVPVEFGQECDPGFLTAETIGDTESDIIPSIFSNYLTGIRALGPDGFSSITVQNSLFEGNQFGIYLQTINQSSVVRNKFIIEDQGYFISYGMSILGSTGFEIERNVFQGNGDLDEFNTGIWISDSENESNTLYLNDFNGLYAGSIAQGTQVDELNDYEGLELLCGKYENCRFNIAVTTYLNQEGKIALRQGDMASSSLDLSAPAGNIFTQTDWNGYDTDYYICPNGDCDPIIYEHHDPFSLLAVKPLEIDPLHVETSNNIATMNDRSSSCPVDPVIEPSELSNLVLLKRLEIDVINSELTQLVDGGNPSAVLQFVNNPLNTSSEIRANLLPLCPYLSDDVLTALILREPSISQWHLFSILSSCSPLKPEIIEQLDSYPNMSQYLYDLLMSYQIGNNDLAIKQSQLKQKEKEKSKALYKLIRNQLNEDEETYFVDEIMSIMTGEELKTEIRKKVGILLQEQRHEEALNELQAYDQDDQDIWKDFIEVLINIDQNGNFYDVSPTQIAQLENLRDSEKFGSHHAASLLEIISGVVPDQILNLPVLDPRNESNNQKTNRISLAKLSPNPANDYIILNFDKPDEYHSLRVKILDYGGKTMDIIDISESDEFLEINTSQLPIGMYLLDFEINKSTVETLKFQIVR